MIGIIGLEFGHTKHFATIAPKTIVAEVEFCTEIKGVEVCGARDRPRMAESSSLGGARGRTRTGMEFPPRDFKSLASTSFATRAGRFLVIFFSMLNSDCGASDLYWLVATHYRSGNFTWFVQSGGARAGSTEI